MELLAVVLMSLTLGAAAPAPMLNDIPFPGAVTAEPQLFALSCEEAKRAGFVSRCLSRAIDCEHGETAAGVDVTDVPVWLRRMRCHTDVVAASPR